MVFQPGGQTWRRQFRRPQQLQPQPLPFSDDFSAYSPRNACLANTTVLGPWEVLWGSTGDGGCTQLTGPDEYASVLEQKPATATSSGQTFSAVTTGPSYSGTFSFSCLIRTVAQLRTGSAPNNWETAWVFWDFAFPHPGGSGTDCYYYIIKESGTEFGRLNNGTQTILATTGNNLNPALWHNVYVTQTVSGGSTAIAVYLDGAGTADITYTDSGAQVLTGGALACYCEDSRVHFTGWNAPGVSQVQAYAGLAPASGMTRAVLASAGLAAAFGKAPGQPSYGNAVPGLAQPGAVTPGSPGIYALGAGVSTGILVYAGLASGTGTARPPRGGAGMMATLQDNFAVNDLAVLWNRSYGTYSVSGGLLAIRCDTSYSSAVLSSNVYDLTGSYLSAKVTPYAAASAQTALTAFTDANNEFQLLYTGGTLSAAVVQGGVTASSPGMAYSAVNHAWWRIREASGTVYFDTSPDSLTWANFWSHAYAIPATAMYAYLQAGDFGSDAAGTSYFDNINTLPGAAQAGLATGTGTALSPGMAQAGLATGTGTAFTPGMAQAGLAAGTGTAQQPAVQPAVAASAGLASGTGTVTASVMVQPGLAAGTGTASQPYILTGTGNAGLATGTGAAPASGMARAGLAAGTGAAQATAFTMVQAGLPAGTGTAPAPGMAQAGLAAGTGTASSGMAVPAILATAAGTAQPGAFIMVQAGLAAGAGIAPASGMAQPAAAAGTGTALAPLMVALATSPGLEAYGFGTFPQVPAGANILSVIAAVTQYSSDAGIEAPVYQLWDGTSAQIGSSLQGASSTVRGHTDTVVFTGAVYSQLATLRLRIYSGSAGANSGATASVDAVSLSVSWSPLVNAAAVPGTLAVFPAFPAAAIMGSVNSSAAPGVLAVVPAFPAASAGIQSAAAFPAALAVKPAVAVPAVNGVISASVFPGTLAVTPALPAITSVTRPGWASAEDIAAAGAGSWANAGSVTGTPDGSYAVWTVP